MSSIVYSCLNFLQHGIITQEISPKNNYTIWKIPILIPLNFPIVRRLPILFIYKLSFYCDIMSVFIFICQDNQVLFSDICTCFLRIWNFFASPTKLLIDVNVSHCCEHVNISKAPSRREFPIVVDMSTYQRHQAGESFPLLWTCQHIKGTKPERVSHCCEHVNISKAPSRRGLQNGPSAKC